MAGRTDDGLPGTIVSRTEHDADRVVRCHSAEIAAPVGCRRMASGHVRMTSGGMAPVLRPRLTPVGTTPGAGVPLLPAVVGVGWAANPYS